MIASATTDINRLAKLGDPPSPGEVYLDRADRIYSVMMAGYLAYSHSNLGSVAQNRGDLLEARNQYEQALRLYETVEPAVRSDLNAQLRR